MSILAHALRFVILPLALVVLFGLGFLGTAGAQSPTATPPAAKSPFGVGSAQPSPLATGQAAASQSWWQQAVALQQAYVRDMAKHVKALKSDHPWAAASALAGIAFLYGVLHAAGPGHGKAVISSYVLANRDTARRGIALSFLAAFFQACSAILFVAILALILRTTATEMKLAEAWIERLSWVFVIGVGAWLLWRQVRPMTPAVSSTEAAHGTAGHSHVGGHAHVHADGSVCHHHHGHHHGPHRDPGHEPHGHGHGHGHGPGHRHAAAQASCAHEHQPGHVHGPDCGHAHMPSPQDLEGPWSWRRALAISLGIGMRPCTGAILLMVFALSQGLLWAGIFATFMMSLGTALTVSILAVLAVSSRDLALWLTGGAESRWGQRLTTGVGIAAALLVIGLGITGLVNPTPEPMFTTR